MFDVTNPTPEQLTGIQLHAGILRPQSSVQPAGFHTSLPSALRWCIKLPNMVLAYYITSEDSSGSS